MPARPGTPRVPHHPPETRRNVKAAYVTGSHATLTSAARAFGVPYDTARGWSLAEHWDKLRADYDRRAQAMASGLPALETANGHALSGAISQMGALCVATTDPDAAIKFATALQILEMTHFAVTHGYWPGNPKPSPEPPKAAKPPRPGRLSARDKDPLPMPPDAPQAPNPLTPNDGAN